jgi:thiamine biosynthesis lipoprotein
MNTRTTMLGAAIAAGCVLLGAASLRGAARAHAADDPGQTRWFRYQMGTSVRVEVYGGTVADREAAATEAFGAIAEVDRLMSDYRVDSELSHLNESAAHAPVAVSPPMFAVLDAAERVSRASGGAFDVTVGPLVRLWGFKDKRAHVPTPAELAEVRPVIGFRNVVIDRESRAVRFARPGVQIDLGGIAKGFAVEVAAGSLRRRSLSGLIDAGGNQFMVGLPPGKHRWSVGIGRPDAPQGLLGALDLPGGALSTSSDASNFLSENGRTYGHLLDPRSLQPSNASLSVTIVSPDGTLSDALSKAVFVLGPRNGLALLASFPGTSGIVAYRQANGGIGVALSPSLTQAFHPSPKAS